MTSEHGGNEAFAVALVATLIIASACSGERGPEASARSSDPAIRAEQSQLPGQPDFRTMLGEVARRQQVEIVWTGGPYRYDAGQGSGSAGDPAEDDVARVAAFIARELSLYPKGFLRGSGFEGIVLVRDLYVRQDGGERGATAYIFDDRFFRDVPLAERAMQAGTRVRFIHHLIRHRLDEQAGTLWIDPEWEALNPPDFAYGVHSRGGVHETRAGSGSLSTEYTGFLNLYIGNLPDDKAEVYAYLMVLHSWVTGRAREDPHLARKVAAIKSRLADLHQSFDDAFWSRIDADSDDAARCSQRQ